MIVQNQDPRCSTSDLDRIIEQYVEAENRWLAAFRQHGRREASPDILGPLDSGTRSRLAARAFALLTAEPDAGADFQDPRGSLVRVVLEHYFDVIDADLVAILELAAAHCPGSHWIWWPVQKAVDHLLAGGELDEPVRAALLQIWERVKCAGRQLSFAAWLGDLLGTTCSVRVAAESWVGDLAATEHDGWLSLLALADTVSQGRPAAGWLRKADALLDQLGSGTVAAAAVSWLATLDDPPALPLTERQVRFVRGLAWICSRPDAAGLAQALERAAEQLLRRVPEIGPRSQAAANACISSLGAMPGTEPARQLIALRSRCKDRVTQPQIEKALQAAAERSNTTLEDLEDLSLPTFGLDSAGQVATTVGAFTATFAVDGTRVGGLEWRDQAGKPRKSMPTTLRSTNAAELRELRQLRTDMTNGLAAQRERLDVMMLSQRSLPVPLWRECYLDHPLLQHLARRLIWSVVADDEERSLICLDGSPLNENGESVSWPSDAAAVQLWHPLAATLNSVLRWRSLIEEHGAVQPFKQAHREVYLLTDAERATNSYSNRFAAHIVRQHQFKALCDARGWRYRLIGGYDMPPQPVAIRPLPGTALHAEFWVSPAGDLEYGSADVAESGIYRYLATDQVRFCGAGGQGVPLPLTEVPPLLFSEVMREIDLFIGVAGLASDPTWFDRGGETGLRGYWFEASFGELTETALTRRDLLLRLLPRLKIAERCRLEGRYLHVRGDLGTYRLHLGSGNILMSPGDRFICIVPASKALAPDQPVHLPFEGDDRLSTILSKAFMLADDTQITDPTIVRQIRTLPVNA